jgi:hypothetical protein
MLQISNVHGLRLGEVFMISLATVWLRTGPMPRWLAVASCGLALTLLGVIRPFPSSRPMGAPWRERARRRPTGARVAAGSRRPVVAGDCQPREGRNFLASQPLDAAAVLRHRQARRRRRDPGAPRGQEVLDLSSLVHELDGRSALAVEGGLVRAWLVSACVDWSCHGPTSAASVDGRARGSLRSSPCDASRVLVTRFEVTDGHHLGHPMNEATSQLLDRSGQVAIVTGG